MTRRWLESRPKKRSRLAVSGRGWRLRSSAGGKWTCLSVSAFSSREAQADELSARIRLSRIVHSFKHSHHLRYALKVAAGTTLLALPGLLPVGSAGRVWFQDSNAEWAVIS